MDADPTEAGDASEPSTPASAELSHEELQDLAVAAIARTMPEAVFLTETLEDADIPAASRNDNTGGLTGNAFETRICVPRALLARAKAVIAKARHQSEDQSVVNAFDPQAVEENLERAPADWILDQMLSLRDLDMESRLARLEEFLVTWLTEELKPVDLARYLAAAGLDLAQANALLKKVRAEQTEAILEKKRRNYGVGMGLIGLGIFMFILQALIRTGYRAVVIVPLGIFFTGVAMMHSSSQPIPKSLMNDPTGPDDTKV